MSYLAWRIKVNGRMHEVINFFFYNGKPIGNNAIYLIQFACIQIDALTLHFKKHLNKGKFYRVKERIKSVLFKLFLEQGHQAPCLTSIIGCIIKSFLKRHEREVFIAMFFY